MRPSKDTFRHFRHFNGHFERVTSQSQSLTGGWWWPFENYSPGISKLPPADDENCDTDDDGVVGEGEGEGEGEGNHPRGRGEYAIQGRRRTLLQVVVAATAAAAATGVGDEHLAQAEVATAALQLFQVSPVAIQG